MLATGTSAKDYHVRMVRCHADEEVHMVGPSGAGAGGPSAGTSGTVHVAGQREDVGFTTFISRQVRHTAVTTFLPAGYPATTGANYLRFAYLQSLNNVAVTANSVLASTFMLYAVGLGAGSIPTAGALNWVLKDGMGQLGTLLFGKTIAHNFDVHSKSWFFLSAAMLQAASALELLTVLVPEHFLLMGSLANTLKGLAWMAAGSTRSVFHLSFARDSNIADVTAKGTSQYIFASLVGTASGAVMCAAVGQSMAAAAGCYSLLAAATLVSAYVTVQSIPLATLNATRLQLLADAFLASISVAPRDPAAVAAAAAAAARSEGGGLDGEHDWQDGGHHLHMVRPGPFAALRDLGLGREEGGGGAAGGGGACSGEAGPGGAEGRGAGAAEPFQRSSTLDGFPPSSDYSEASSYAASYAGSEHGRLHSAPGGGGARGYADADSRAPYAHGHGHTSYDGVEDQYEYDQEAGVYVQPELRSGGGGDGAGGKRRSKSRGRGVDRCYVGPSHLQYDTMYDDSLEPRIPNPLELCKLDPPLPHWSRAAERLTPRIHVGTRLEDLVEGNANLLVMLLTTYRYAHFMVVPRQGSLHLVLHERADPRDMVQAYLQACILRRRLRAGVSLPCPDESTAELRLELQESLAAAERLTTIFMNTLEANGWTTTKVVVEAQRRRARW